MPNYALLGNIKDMMIPQQENPIVAGLDKYLKMQNENKKLDAELSLAKAQQELYGAQIETKKKELEYLPQQMDLEKQKALASISATNASASATRQSMANAAQELNMKKTQAAFELLGGVLTADPAKQPQAYNAALGIAKKMGYGEQLKGLTGDIEKDRSQLEYLYTATGQQLKQAQMQRELAQIPLETAIDPATGKAVYVRRDQAAGMQPADPKLAGVGGAGAGNPIAAELPKVQARQLTAYQTKAAEEAELANTLSNQLDAFEKASAKVPLGTGVKYHIPGSSNISADVQTAQQITKELTLKASSQLKGAISDRDMITIEKSMPSITNKPEANKVIGDRMKTASMRVQQKPLFIQTMINNGVYDPGVIQTAWTQYINENSIFNEKTGKLNKENITNWKKYTGADYINKLNKGSSDTTNKAAEQNAMPVRRYNPETGMIE